MENMEYKYINEIFARMDLRQMREFLLSGIELNEPDKRSYAERLEKGSRHIVNRIKYNSKDKHELDEIYNEFSEATEAYTEVFIEIGMKAGARLLFQLLHQNE